MEIVKHIVQGIGGSIPLALIATALIKGINMVQTAILERIQRHKAKSREPEIARL